MSQTYFRAVLARTRTAARHRGRSRCAEGAVSSDEENRWTPHSAACPLPRARGRSDRASPRGRNLGVARADENHGVRPRTVAPAARVSLYAEAVLGLPIRTELVEDIFAPRRSSR